MTTTTTTNTTTTATRRYTCEGPVRGECGTVHRSYAAAAACCDRDQDGCADQGGYSDREVVVVEPHGSTRPLSDDEFEAVRLD